MVKASVLRAGDPRFDSRLCHGDFYKSSNTSDLKLGTPVTTRCLRCRVSARDWLAWCKYTVTGYGRKFDLQLLSQCGSMHVELSEQMCL